MQFDQFFRSSKNSIAFQLALIINIPQDIRILRLQLHYTGLLAYRITFSIGLGFELHYSAVIRYITLRES